MRRNLRRCRAVMDARKFTTCSPCIIRGTVNSNFTPVDGKTIPSFRDEEYLWRRNFTRKIEKYTSREYIASYSIFFEDGNLANVLGNYESFCTWRKIVRVVTSALESEKLARGFAVSSRGFHFELNVRKSSLQMYANPWPGRKGISGIKSPFSISIHRSSVMNRHDSIVDGSFICTSFEEKSVDVSKTDRKIFTSYTWRTREGILFRRNLREFTRRNRDSA